MSELKEYIVTLKSKDDLDGFYDDMETPGGDLYIPDRAVGLVNRRPNSRNTHYMLSDAEAELLRADPRILSVELTPGRLGLVVKPAYDQTSDFWVKSSANTATHVNWGLLRVVEGAQRTNWGSDSNTTESGSIKINSAGRNVDIVVVDGHINPSHPEYALNADGTGGSRVVQYNWFQHNTTVLGTANSTYVYTPYVDGGNANRTDDNDHGAHVAGTVAGNTQGWARAANIYNINPYSTNVNTYDALYIFDYIRAFHNSKPVNPSTGRKNPTIVNNSWGYFYEISIATISQVNYRGNVVLSGGTVTQANLDAYGVLNNGATTVVPARYYALDADVSDAIEDGIIVVGAAGNNSFKIDVAGGVDIDNYFVFSSGGSNFAVYYHEGSSPGSSPGAITVGSISTLSDERKSSFSNCGPRIDIYAPGSLIMSSINSTTFGVADSRNSSYNLIKYSGTSMASPQVAGVLACMMEIYPGMTQTQALDYIVSNSKSGQMTDTAGGYTDLASLQASSNRYLYYSRERPVSGSTWPKVNFFVRPDSGALYPRYRIRK
jgi:subtilisin family serine protease